MGLYGTKQWPCSAAGSLWEMLDSNGDAYNGSAKQSGAAQMSQQISKISLSKTVIVKIFPEALYSTKDKGGFYTCWVQ